MPVRFETDQLSMCGYFFGEKQVGFKPSIAIMIDDALLRGSFGLFLFLSRLFSALLSF
jgi:hypothetical protein